MNINEKIAARRREVELERQQAVAAEISRKKAEHEAQQEAIRLAKLEVATSIVENQKPIEMPGYMVSTSVDPLTDVSIEEKLINESLERVTKRELFIFLMLMVLSVFNILRGEIGRTLIFGIIALIYIAYVLKKHWDEIILMENVISDDHGKEI